MESYPFQGIFHESDRNEIWTRIADSIYAPMPVYADELAIQNF